MKTERECLEDMGWFLNKAAVSGIYLPLSLKLYGDQVSVFYYQPIADEGVICWDGPSDIKITSHQFYPTQKPIRVNYVGANSSDDEIFYLLNDPEAKAEYERQLLLEATKESAVNKTTSKRRM